MITVRPIVKEFDAEGLAASGWLVTVHADCALHYPGRTVAVYVEEPGHRMAGSGLWLG